MIYLPLIIVFFTALILSRNWAKRDSEGFAGFRLKCIYAVSALFVVMAFLEHRSFLLAFALLFAHFAAGESRRTRIRRPIKPD
ncbi:MAG: hypothetical protein ABSG31_08800 [Tepidisphaeraceae bacterium]